MISRRHLLATAGAVPIAFGAGIPALAQSVDKFELMMAGPLGEKAQGNPDAPVTMIEYASMTCGHCATFHIETYPTLKERYIDTGKVYFIMREFPLDGRAAAAFMLARCVDEDRYFDFIDLLFAQQQSWARAEPNKVVDALFNMARQGGMTRADFDACLTNQELLDGINWVRTRAERFRVSSTPTFFINGQLVRGALTVAELEQQLERHLGS